MIYVLYVTLKKVIQCFNDNTKPKNFYFNSTINKYRICYHTCLTCNEDGDENNNNCLTCSNNYIKTLIIQILKIA